MRAATPPVPQYASMAWCSVKKSAELYIQTNFGKFVNIVVSEF